VDLSGLRAVILAGGKGTRLKPLTAVFPKPLVPLGSRSVIEILLHRLRLFGIRDVTICTGHLAELVMAVCGDGSRFGLSIQYVKEEKSLGTAGPLASVEGLTEPFLVMNGDLLTDLDFRRLVSYHVERRCDITLSVHRREVNIDFGVVESDEHLAFTGFKEKPTYHFEVSMGVNVLSRSVLSRVRVGERLDMPDLILKIHEAGGTVCCFREPCYWLDIGRMDDYALAQDHFEKNESLFPGGAA
jgi:NDP-sugar pyrophosphorylase family protein